MALAMKIISEPVEFGDWYTDLVVAATKDDREHVDEYKMRIEDAYPQGYYAVFNSNDFANIHHSAWLYIGHALASLTNLNPHGDWGDPPANGSAHPTPGDPLTIEADSATSTNHPLESSLPGLNLMDLQILFYNFYHFYHFVPNHTGYYAVSSSDIPPPNTGV
ncbi:MAG: hypothetical protein QOI11_875 [Candidatus Eremiobacteraeota bacterium]|nr:hypothetical protein [Candidatus Eremiobacteraeota bacterium]